MKGKVLGLVLLVLSGTAVADGGCPVNTEPRLQDYMDGPSGQLRQRVECVPSGSSDGGSQSSAQQPIWADRWGAIAFDDENSIAGAVTDMTSKRKAQKAAIQECKNRGGGRCVIKTSYNNQCAVIVAGNNRSDFVNASTIDRASDIGMQSCHERNDTNCRVYYSGCSTAVRVQ